MSGNKQVYKEAFDRARSGKARGLWQRILFPFQDHYTQQSREQGEHDGELAHTAAAPATVENAPAPGA
jgi:hypothetical protein